MNVVVVGASSGLGRCVAIGLGSASGWWDSHGDGDAPEDPVIDAADGALEPAWEAFSGTHLLLWNAAAVQRDAEDALDDLSASIAHVPDGAAKTLLRVIDKYPEIVLDVLADEFGTPTTGDPPPGDAPVSPGRRGTRASPGRP